MPQTTPAVVRCRNCDGFPRVAVTTGEHNPDGTRRTLRISCPACHGTGTTRPAPVLREVTGRG